MHLRLAWHCGSASIYSKKTTIARLHLTHLMMHFLLELSPPNPARPANKGQSLKVFSLLSLLKIFQSHGFATRSSNAASFRKRGWPRMDQIDHCSFDHYFTLLFTPGTQSPVAQNGKSHIRFSIFLVALDSLIGHTRLYKWTFRQKKIWIRSILCHLWQQFY